jgi:hypothetical protein
MQGLACEQAEVSSDTIDGLFLFRSAFGLQSYGSYPQYYHASPGSSGAETSAASSDESSQNAPSLVLSVDHKLRQLCKEEGTSKKVHHFSRNFL